jgi:predicted enzyme related to lactoylglutathione lyase
MTSGMPTTIYPVRDLSAAKALFGALLAAEPYVDQPYYVGYRVEGQEIGLDPNGHGKGMTGPIGYWPVADISERLERLVAAGAQLHEPAHDVGGGTLIATVIDADGNVVGLVQPA